MRREGETPDQPNSHRREPFATVTNCTDAAGAPNTTCQLGLAKAIAYAHDKGVTVVCAAGNDGRGKVSYPAAYPHSIAVASTQFDETTTFYSNWGKEIDIAAPGGNTRVDQNGDGFPDGVLQNTVVPGDTSRNDYLWFMGTSMASPHVVGVAALVISAGVTDPDAVKKILKETARPPKAGQHAMKKDEQNRYGAGIIDADAAVAKARAKTGVAELFVSLGGAALVVSAGGLSLIPGIGSAFWAQGLPAWDLAFGATAHGNPIFYSALVPVLGASLLYGARRLRGLVAGLALGVAGHLAVHALIRTMDVQWIPNSLDALWLGANAAVSAWAVLRK